MAFDLAAPRVTPQNQPFWDAIAEGRLTTTYCPACGERTGYPPRIRCPRCLSAKLKWIDLNSAGVIYSWTRIWVSGAQFADQLPYLVCIVDLVGGPRMAGRLTWEERADPAIGDRVKLRFDDPIVRFSFVREQDSSQAE
jgi:uncharacterized OB-fold protein